MMSSVNGDDKERFETRVVHAGSEPEINNWAVVTPISLATTFIQVKHSSPRDSRIQSKYCTKISKFNINTLGVPWIKARNR